MGNTDDLEKILLDNNCFIEDFSGYRTQVPQALMVSKNVAAFEKFIKDYSTAFKPIFVFKYNSGANQFTYNTLGNLNQWGMSITIDNGAQAPGVVVKMGAIENFEAWLLSHDTTRKFCKGLIVFGVTFAAANQAGILNGLPVWAAWAVVPLGALINAAANYIQTHNTLPIFGMHVQ